MMVELFAAGLTGDVFSYEAKKMIIMTEGLRVEESL
jgi:hypothetical protein